MKVEQEKDRIPGKEILLIILAVTVVTAIGVLVAWLFTARGEGRLPFDVSRARYTEGMAAAQAPPTLFYEAPQAPAYRVPKEQRMTRFGWVDQRAGVVHIPLERAMQLHLERHERDTRRQEERQ